MNNGTINADCSDLALGMPLCLAITGEDCQPVDVVAEGDTCTSVADAAGTTVSTLVTNNPILGEDCTALYPGLVSPLQSRSLKKYTDPLIGCLCGQGRRGLSELRLQVRLDGVYTMLSIVCTQDRTFHICLSRTIISPRRMFLKKNLALRTSCSLRGMLRAHRDRSYILSLPVAAQVISKSRVRSNRNQFSRLCYTAEGS